MSYFGVWILTCPSEFLVLVLRVEKSLGLEIAPFDPGVMFSDFGIQVDKLVLGLVSNIMRLKSFERLADFLDPSPFNELAFAGSPTACALLRNFPISASLSTVL